MTKSTELDQLLRAKPDVIVDTMRQEPSMAVYRLGAQVLREMMDAQLSPHGADSVGHHMHELELARLGYEFASAIEARFV